MLYRTLLKVLPVTPLKTRVMSVPREKNLRKVILDSVVFTCFTVNES